MTIMIGMEFTELAEETSISKILGRKVVKKSEFALCIEDADCDYLERRKLCQILPDEEATQEGI